MKFLDEEIEKYAEAHTSEESSILKKVHRDTYANVIMPRMLSGHLQGRILATFSHMIKPNLVLEIGTYTGYSALCLAEGIADGGKIITIDINEELEEKVKGFFQESDFRQKIDYRIGNALDIIPTLSEKFDLVFIDADKENYGKYFDIIIDKVQKGGFIVADNVLWSGKVIPGKSNGSDKDTKALIDFNLKVHNDTRVENVLLPIRDGLMILKKI
ncbi:O-methyltransferase [Fulvivirgaceae bacterium BMA12]|uniref:O-methyltransferase n=1 Tax=Agaribacillus aureus TaxID=3051825 RepID=A0ABT8LC63_9BACT|nr:O-methyltransferase [Fulvivirgaceae bacterium BMA12]